MFFLGFLVGAAAMAGLILYALHRALRGAS